MLAFHTLMSPPGLATRHGRSSAARQSTTCARSSMQIASAPIISSRSLEARRAADLRPVSLRAASVHTDLPYPLAKSSHDAGLPARSSPGLSRLAPGWQSDDPAS